MNLKIDNIKIDDIGETVEILNIVLLGGGRTSFYCQNDSNNFWIRIVTNGFEDLPYKQGYWPGGLYFNDRLIEFDSDEEKQLATILKKLTVSEGYLSFFSKKEHKKRD